MAHKEVGLKITITKLTRQPEIDKFSEDYYIQYVETLTATYHWGNDQIHLLKL